MYLRPEKVGSEIMEVYNILRYGREKKVLNRGKHGALYRQVSILDHTSVNELLLTYNTLRGPFDFAVKGFRDIFYRNSID